jgi:hypothetical protein
MYGAIDLGSGTDNAGSSTGSAGVLRVAIAAQCTHGVLLPPVLGGGGKRRERSEIASDMC